MLTASCQILFLHYFCFCSFLIIKKHSPNNKKKVSLDPVFEIITDINRAIACCSFFNPIFAFSVFVHFSLFKKRSPWTPSMTGGA